MHVFDILKYAAIGFNRYMVECESKPGRVVPSRFSVLIDTWWNVNGETLNFAVRGFCVLIDTWWNVNYIQQSKILNPNKVLIDTWWNVNLKVCL